MRAIDNFVQHAYYCNAIGKRKDGKFILSNEKRLSKNLKIYFNKQMNYVLNAIRGEFPVEPTTNSLKTNTSKTKLKQIADDIPYQKEIAEELKLFEEDTLKRGVKTVVADFSLGRFGIGWEQVNEEAKAFIGDKLSHELSDYKGTIHANTVDKINEILYDSLVQGRSAGETSKLIQAQGDAGVFSQARGELISTREMRVAYNEGNYLPMNQLAIDNPDRQVLKQWLTVGDDRVEPTHAENEAFGWVEMDFIYTATGGDTVAPGSDNPRCRCDTIYKII